MTAQEAAAARYEVEQYYSDGLISYREYSDAFEAVEVESEEL